MEQTGFSQLNARQFLKGILRSKCTNEDLLIKGKNNEHSNRDNRRHHMGASVSKGDCATHPANQDDCIGHGYAEKCRRRKPMGEGLLALAEEIREFTAQTVIDAGQQDHGVNLGQAHTLP